MTNRSVHVLWQPARDRLAEHTSYHPKTKITIHVHTNTCMQSVVHILSHRPKEEKMEWEEVKGIEWEAVGEKDGERGRGRVGVSGTWLSV